MYRRIATVDIFAGSWGYTCGDKGRTSGTAQKQGQQLIPLICLPIASLGRLLRLSQALLDIVLQHLLMLH